jgi:hypothetical protein
MKTSSSLPGFLHFDPARPCCETAAAADLFPNLLNLKTNQINRGRVASVVMQSEGIGVQRSELIVDSQAWEECVKTPHFRACYDLSMAKLALQGALGPQ